MFTKTIVARRAGIFSICLLALVLAAEVRPQIPSDQNAPNRSAVKCLEDSPERRGEEGCTILATRPISGSMRGPVYWHIDRFASFADARKAAGPNSVAAEAHGGVWLMTVENKTRNHHGGRHAAWMGPLVLPRAKGYTMRVISSLLKEGASTPVHSHSGPEVWYVVVGEQCLETEGSAHLLKAGKSFILPADQIHRGRVQSAAKRGSLALVLHDSNRPASRDFPDAESPVLTRCK